MEAVAHLDPYGFWRERELCSVGDTRCIITNAFITTISRTEQGLSSLKVVAEGRTGKGSSHPPPESLG